MGCCLAEHSKYEMLLESTPGFVCCNAPCTSLEASYKAGSKVHLFALPSVTTATGLMVSNQTVCNGNMGSTLCAPGMRRYFSNSNGIGMQGGMMDMNMQLATMGMFGGGPSPSPCMGLILKAMGILLKATVNLAPDLGLLNLSIPHRRTPLLRSNLQGSPSLPLNIKSTLNILSSLNNLFTSSNLSTNLDLPRTTTSNLATTSLHKPLSTSIL